MLDALHYWPRTYILAGAVSFVVSAVLMPVAILVMHRAGVLDRGGGHKIHDRPVPRGGGIVLFIAFAAGVLLPNYRDNPMKAVMFGAAACLLVGAIDDWRGGIPAVFKFLTLLLVTFVMSRYDVLIQITGIYALDLFITLVWVVGVTSAFNGIDNMDGLGGGIATIVSGMYLVIALQAFAAAGTETSLSWFGLLAAGLIGANLGFLIYNVGPARIFMGDAGSFFLGFTLAALGVMGEWSQNRIVSICIPVLILGVPIFDFAYILVARILRGDTRTVRQVIEHCATDHLSHRLVWIGFSRAQAVMLIYLIAIAMGTSGVLLRNSTSYVDSALALCQGGSVVVIVIVLMAAAARQHRTTSSQSETES